MRQSNKKSMKKAKYPIFIFIRGNHPDPDAPDETVEDGPGGSGGKDGESKPPPP
jgi:hypothetical protein